MLKEGTLRRKLYSVGHDCGRERQKLPHVGDIETKRLQKLPFLRPWHLSCLALSLSACRVSRLGSHFSRLEGNSAGPHPHVTNLLGLCSA